MVEVYNESVYDVLVSPEEGHEKLQLQKKGNDVIVPVSLLVLCTCRAVWKEWKECIEVVP